MKHRRVFAAKAVTLSLVALACAMLPPAGAAADPSVKPGATQEVAGATGDAAALLVKRLVNGNIREKMDVAFQIVRLGDKSVVRDLVALLRSDNAQTREYALIALGGLHDPRSIEAIRLALGDQVGDVGAAAQAALRKFGKEAEPVLLQAIKDNNARTAWKAAMLLAQLGNPAGANQLLDAVAKGSPGERREGMKFLAELGDARAVPLLVEALVDREPDVAKKSVKPLEQLLASKPAYRAEVVKALREKQAPLHKALIMQVLAGLKHPPAIAVFVELATHPDPIVRQAAVAALGLSQTQQHAGLLQQALHDSHPGVRQAAICAIGEMADTNAVPQLMSIVQTGSVSVARSAAAALVKIGPAAAPSLLPLLGSAPLPVRMLAANALGDLHAAAAADALLAMAQEKETGARAAAANALGRLGDPRAIPLLIRLLADEDEQVAENAALSLADLGKDAATPLLAALRQKQTGVTAALCARALSAAAAASPAVLDDLWKSGNESDRSVALLAAEQLGAEAGSAFILAAVRPEVAPPLRGEALRILGTFLPEDRAPLLAALEEPAPDVVAAAAAAALGSLGASEAAVPIQKLLTRESPVARLAALQALEELGSTNAAPALLPLLADTNAAIRAAAVRTLGLLGGPAATAPIARLTSDPDAEVRLAAAGALGEISDPAAVAALRGLLATNDVQLRQIALDGLGRHGGAAELTPLLNASREGSPRVREKALVAAAQALRRDRDGRTSLTQPQIEDVAALLRNPAASTRIQASQFMACIGPRAVPVLAPFAGKAESKATRLAALHALAGVASRDATELVVGIVKTDPDEDIQCSALLALARIRDARALTPVTIKLNSTNENVRACAAFALGRMGDSRAVGALMKATNDASEPVRKKAREGLLLLTGNKCPLVIAVTPYPFVEPTLFGVMIFLLVMPLLRKWFPPVDRLAARLFGRIRLGERGQFWLAAALGLMGLALLSYSIYCQITQPGLESFVPGFLTNLFLFTLKTFPFFVGGCLISGLVMKYFSSRWHLPRSMAGACILGAILPLCSCGVVPLTRAMMAMNIPRRTVIAFLVVTPVLNPFVIVLSYGVIGSWFTFFRVFGTFLVAVVMGYLIEWLVKEEAVDEMTPICKFCSSCVSKDQPQSSSGLINGLRMMGMLHRYIIIGVILGAAMAAYLPMTLVTKYLGSDIFGLLLAVVIGAPLYLCTGEEVVFLKPLMDLGLPLGHAIAFTISANGICITSIAVLVGVLGRRTTTVLTVLFAVLPFILGFVINLFFR
jgi:HEAT repeat protein/uncharacterized membrane protein YraQ (UPF0718 family)